ncbi:uncharacterized protein [Magallana gigas]|uniref:uncharacterized protein isoform X3 n=1 Tax=Magallana gigas TaxID=29159 RepID=UPI00333F0868
MEMHCKVTVYVSLLVVWSFSEYACFENLALGKLANQSSNYLDSFDAAKAIDGNRQQVMFSYTCAKTGKGHITASWNVDLGKIMSIHHVDIYYSKESDSEYESTSRGTFAGFSLYISNSTNLNNESLCYHRLQNGTNSPPSVMSIQCEMIGRYVTIYNERLPEQTYPDYYSSTAELELCEVEVYGCQGISQYGDYCLTCPSTCPDARCNMSTGSCFQCLDGFTGDNCTESTTVRLVEGLTKYQGRLEVYYNGTWGTVYQSYYHYNRHDVYKNLAAVVCRSLGLPWITSEGYCCSRYGHGSGPVWLADVQCLGNETEIEECSHSGWGYITYMYHWEDVSIDCLPNTNPVRLAGGSTVYEGRVEVYRNGVWGTVCDESWDDQNTAVVCTSMGFSSERAKTLHDQPFGRGTGQVYMNGVECQGNESSILQCYHRGWGNHVCDHSKDVSVNCTSYSSITIRLTGGPTPYEGRVEVYINGSWGTVSDAFGVWNDASTAVVCKSIGYLWDNATVYRLYQHGSGPIHICNVQCSGTETDLMECLQFYKGYDYKDYCIHYNDIYVKCDSGIDECAEQPCQNNGTCVDLMNDYECYCMDGFNGTDCTKNINDCQPDPCQNNGTCTDLVNDYECDCVAGINGTNCENNIDECDVRPCQNNGTCVDLINEYKCYCMDGFNGKNCINNIDDCLPDHCQNNGTCIDLVNDYQCDCMVGFNGTNCENNINDCIPEPCQNNGTCIDLINDYQCNCTQGFNGTNCENNIDDCLPDPCQNNGTCTDLVNDYLCDCMVGFNGISCENNINDCVPEPCQNNGTCIDLINDYQCNCTQGFNGTNCANNIDDCLPDPCENNGTCTDLVNDYHCGCVEGFNGTHCENNIDECEVQPCQNNGSCVDLINGYQCYCTDGFNGANCAIDIDECASQPCQNNGTCIDLINEYKCRCTDGYNGKNCTNDTYVLHILNFESSNLVLHEGKSTWFKLQLKNKTTNEVKWFHNGYVINNPPRRYKITSLRAENDTSLHTLYIENVLQRDMGAWKITVSNQVTYVSREMTLKVIPRLVLHMNPTYDFSILRGDKINLQCTVTNPESLFDVNNGSLVITKDGSVLQDVSSSTFSTTWNKYSAVEADSGRYTCTHRGYHVPVTASVYVTVIQPEQKRCESEWSEGILWNATLAGTTKQESCPANQKGFATRYCDQHGMWASPSLINCTTEAFTDASSQLDGIIEDGIQNTKKVQETVNNTLQMMKNLTSSTNELSAGDLSSSLDILEKIVDVTNSTGSAIEKEVFYSVIDNVLSANNSKSWTTVSDKTGKDASSILKNMERLSEVVMQSDNVSTTQFSGSNFELTINQTKIDETGIRFPEISTNNVSGNSEQIPTFLELPKQDTKSEKAINYVAVIYKTMSDILPSESVRDPMEGQSERTSKKKEFVNSPILSLTTQNDLGVLMPPLNLTFGHIKNNKSTEMHGVCVSWDFSLSKWTERGCKVSHSDFKRTVCQCNHLTNFAILMRPYSPATEDKQSLKTMSLVGVILSISFTALTCVIYILTWRYIKSDQNIIMMNLCGSLTLSYVIFISAVEQTGNEGACIATTAIIHYLFLVTFFSMLGMGVYYFMSITVTYYAMYVANNFKSESRVHWFLLAIWEIDMRARYYEFIRYLRIRLSV